MRTLAIRTAIVVGILLALGPRGAAQADSAFSALPAGQQGDTWTYALAGGGTDTPQVADTSGGIYTVIERTSSEDMNILHFTATLTTEDNSALNAMSLLRPQWPLDEKAGWSYSFTDAAVNGKASDYQVAYSTTGAVTRVSVPGGTFDAVVVHIRECSATQRVCGDADAWFAPPAKWCVKIGFTSSGFRGPRAGNATVLTAGPHQA